ncbi:hypothetical protein [Haliscomenobacter sp.]|uniref:hypothetical protein n=1 Tax=Haliscomenobacter sp. TaxID=2717303 RepID=UPI003364C38B
MKSINDVNLAQLNGGGNCTASSAILVGVGFFLLASVATIATGGIGGVAVIAAYGTATATNAYFCG